MSEIIIRSVPSFSSIFLSLSQRNSPHSHLSIHLSVSTLIFSNRNLVNCSSRVVGGKKEKKKEGEEKKEKKKVIPGSLFECKTEEKGRESVNGIKFVC